MSSELLEKNQHQLVRVLSSLSVQDFLKLSKDLQKHRVLSKQDSDILASLDHDNLDSDTTVRYLLHVVGERVKVDNTLCAHFLKALTGFRNEGVVKFGESLVSQAHAISQRPGEESGPAPEMVFLEEDVGELCNVLASVSYKWEELCVSLKLPKTVIEDCRNAGSNNLRLYRGLTEWVCGRHKKARHPTLSQLKQALNSPFVALPDLALEIEKSWKTNSSNLQESHFTDTVSESSEDLNISLEPPDTTVADGKSTLLEVQVSHSEAVSYKWTKEDKPLSDSSSFSGTHSSMLLIHKASQGVQGEYRCQVNLGSVQLSTSPVQVTVTFPPDKQCLLNSYSSLKEVPQDSWPIEGPNTFVDVALLDTMRGSKPSVVEGEVDDVLQTNLKSTVSLTESFGKYKEGALIILEGRPGSGKTTLTHKITKDWVNGKMLTNASKVFRVSLRKDYDKMELFKSFYHSKVQAYVELLEECGGKGSCFILDGYDEFSNSQDDQSVIHQLIHKTYLPLAMVILTSRPVATVTLRPKATKRFESLGFTKKCFEKFVNLYPFQRTSEGEAKAQLKDFLKACSNVLNMCFLPFNASMICFLFDQFGEVGNAPNTETEIYKLFVHAVALRKLRLLNSRAKLQSLEQLPDSDKIIFKQLCLLAFDMTVENKQIVELPASLESLDSSSLRGLLTIDGTIKIVGLEDTVVFLHLTLQEYLAACHMARMDEHQQTEMIRLHSGKGHMLTMFKFYCGLVNFQNRLQQFDDIVESAPNMLYVFHCAYETQLACVCIRAMELLNGKVSLESGVLTPADFTVWAYVITNAPHFVNKLSIMPCLLYEEFIEDKWKNKERDYEDVLSSSFHSSISDNNARAGTEYDLCTQISYHNKSALKKEDRMLDRFGCQLVNEKNPMTMFQSSSDILSSDSAISLVNALKHCSNIEAIQLIGNFKGVRSASHLAEVLRCCSNLKEFLLYGDLSSSEMKLLACGLQHCKSLQSVALCSTDLCSSATEISTILMQCTNMRGLALRHCNISFKKADILFRGPATVNLDGLCLSCNNIGPNGMKLIADHILCKDLSVEHCNIGPEGAMHLARSISLKPVLTSLNLNYNGIDSNSIIALAEGLSHCCNLQKLSLSYNNVGYAGAAALAQCLHSCSKLRELYLQRCNLEGDGIVRLAEQFHSWPNMKALGLSDNGILSDSHMSFISGRIQKLCVLQELCLSNNSIYNAAAKALAKGIQRCPLLHTLDVCENRIGSCGASFLAESMRSKKIKYLDFSYNSLDDACIESFVALVLTSQLQKLDLSHNNIGPTGSKCLVSDLLDCSYLVEVNLASNNISPEDMIYITQLLQRNIRLHFLLK